MILGLPATFNAPRHLHNLLLSNGLIYNFLRYVLAVGSHGYLRSGRPDSQAEHTNYRLKRQANFNMELKLELEMFCLLANQLARQLPTANCHLPLALPPATAICYEISLLHPKRCKRFPKYKTKQ